jgi:hypothetical protein
MTVAKRHSIVLAMAGAFLGRERIRGLTGHVVWAGSRRRPQRKRSERISRSAATAQERLQSGAFQPRFGGAERAALRNLQRASEPKVHDFA